MMSPRKLWLLLRRRSPRSSDRSHDSAFFTGVRRLSLLSRPCRRFCHVEFCCELDERQVTTPDGCDDRRRGKDHRRGVGNGGNRVDCAGFVGFCARVVGRVHVLLRCKTFCSRVTSWSLSAWRALWQNESSASRRPSALSSFSLFPRPSRLFTPPPTTTRPPPFSIPCFVQVSPLTTV